MDTKVLVGTGAGAALGLAGNAIEFVRAGGVFGSAGLAIGGAAAGGLATYLLMRKFQPKAPHATAVFCVIDVVFARIQNLSITKNEKKDLINILTTFKAEYKRHIESNNIANAAKQLHAFGAEMLAFCTPLMGKAEMKNSTWGFLESTAKQQSNLALDVAIILKYVSLLTPIHIPIYFLVDGNKQLFSGMQSSIEKWYREMLTILDTNDNASAREVLIRNAEILDSLNNVSDSWWSFAFKGKKKTVGSRELLALEGIFKNAAYFATIFDYRNLISKCSQLESKDSADELMEQINFMHRSIEALLDNLNADSRPKDIQTWLGVQSEMLKILHTSENGSDLRNNASSLLGHAPDISRQIETLFTKSALDLREAIISEYILRFQVLNTNDDNHFSMWMMKAMTIYLQRNDEDRETMKKEIRQQMQHKSYNEDQINALLESLAGVALDIDFDVSLEEQKLSAWESIQHTIERIYRHWAFRCLTFVLRGVGFGGLILVFKILKTIILRTSKQTGKVIFGVLSIFIFLLFVWQYLGFLFLTEGLPPLLLAHISRCLYFFGIIGDWEDAYRRAKHKFDFDPKSTSGFWYGGLSLKNAIYILWGWFASLAGLPGNAKGPWEYVESEFYRDVEDIDPNEFPWYKTEAEKSTLDRFMDFATHWTITLGLGNLAFKMFKGGPSIPHSTHES